MDMTIIQSIIFGAMQGITEFLPISSSGHIVVVQYLCGIDAPDMAFVVALHVGSLCAVVLYFWRDWCNIFGLKKDLPVYQNNRAVVWYFFSDNDGVFCIVWQRSVVCV